MQGRDIVVVGGSAGAFPALLSIASALPEAFPAAVFFMVHTNAPGLPALNKRLLRIARLPIVLPVDGERILPGRIYLAPGARTCCSSATTFACRPVPKST
jgi:two-component system chemotaxis response regulator CheB